jgi:hypothetical protein
MNNIQIILSKPLNTLPNSVFENGYALFDIPLGFELSETLSVDQLDIFSNFTDNYLIASSLPKTSKNLLIFETYGTDEIDIIVQAEGAILPYRKLKQVKHTDNKTPSFEIQFISENPLRLLKEQKISDLDFGNFNFDISSIQDNMENDVSNLDVNIFLPVCNYGAFYDTGTPLKAVRIKDLRPWFREYNVLKKGLEQIGWTFKSPIHETSFGRKIGNYLNDSLKSETLLNRFSCRAVFPDFQTYTGTTAGLITANFVDNITVTNAYTGIYGNYTITAEGYDYGANTNGYFHLNEIGDLSGSYKFRFTMYVKDGAVFSGRVIIQMQKNGSNIFTPFSFYGGVDYLPTIITTESIEAQPSDNFTFLISGSSDSPIGVGNFEFSLGKCSNIEVLPQEVTIQAGLYENVSKYIKDTYKTIDFLKGVIHGFKGFLNIDYIQKIVTLYTPQTLTDLFDSGETVEGYYTESQIDLRNAQIKSSSVYTYPEPSQPRYYILRYKGGDEFIGDTNPFQKKFDFGERFKNDELINENPFFEPTGQSNNHTLSNIKFPIAVLWDNTDNKLSTNLNPRRCIFENRLPSGASSGNTFWDFEGTAIADYFPTCYVKAETNYGGIQILESLAYGDDNLTVWGDLVYYSELLSSYNEGQFEALFFINPTQYDFLDFRKKYVVLYENYIRNLKLKQVRDYKYNAELPTPLVFKT